MSVEIIVGSSADLNENIISKLTVIPMTVTFGEDEFIDGVTINNTQFYEKLIECDTLPTTSQIPPAVFEEEFQKVTARGNTAVVITLSSKLSGTFQSATIAAADYDNIYVVDSKTVTVGEGILAEMAVNLVDAGKTAPEIAEHLEAERENLRIIAMIDTLEYLKKGGRISKTTALAGGLLNIKPVVSMLDGEIVILGKARGSKQGNNLLVQEIEKSGGIDFAKPVLLGYSGLTDVLLQKYVVDSESLWKDSVDGLPFATIGSIVGTHVGPGAIAVAFFTK